MAGVRETWRRAGIVAIISGSLVLSACAAEPVSGWAPPERQPLPDVALLPVGHEFSREGLPLAPDEDQAAPETAPTSDGDETDEDAGQGDGSDDGPDESSGDGSDESANVRTDSISLRPAEQRELGLYTGRLRNDGAGLAARFVYVPGVPEFNAWVNENLRQAIELTGEAWVPEAFPEAAGLSARGCVRGSTSWQAPRVLARPETGPVGGSGVAVTCDVTGAFGDLIEVQMRTVVGSPDGVTSDTTSMIYADVQTGHTVEIADKWNTQAAEELWLAAIELVRREAGGLSTVPLAAPPPEQLMLAESALDTSVPTDDGGLLVTLPQGLKAPELGGLGIDETHEPVSVVASPGLALSWSNEDYRRLHEGVGEPFSGIRAHPASVPIDCTIFTCIAVTYDDGPGEYTQALLETLEKEQSRVTFFMLGGKAEGWSTTIRRAVDEGHEVASHTMSHPDLTTLPLPEAKQQVHDAANALARVSGQPVTMFRPPYGAINDEIIEAVEMPAILWSIDTNDWQKPGKEELVKRSVGVAKPGSIILFHDIHEESVEVAGEVLGGLRDRGFELVTVTQLFGGQVPAGRVSAR